MEHDAEPVVKTERPLPSTENKNPVQSRNAPAPTDDRAAARLEQDRLYDFPYHHLVDFDARTGAGFTQFRNHTGGYRYAGYLFRLLELLETQRFTSLIDIGCGDGFFLSKLAQRLPDRMLAGVDLCERAIQLARLFNMRADGSPNGVSFESRDIIAAPMDTPFDVATSIHVLEHIPPDFLPEFVRANAALVRPGGRYIAMVPSTRLNLKRIKRHYQHFTGDSLRDVLSHDFNVDEIEYLNNDRPWGGLLSKLLTNRLFVLNSPFLRDRIFRLYLHHFLRCRKPNGLTVMAVCTRL